MKNSMATQVSTETEFSLRHLQAELARIDLQIQRAIWRWRLAGQDPADTFRGLYVSDIEVDRLLARPLGGNWGQTVELSPEEEYPLIMAETQVAEQTQALVAEAQEHGYSLRLAQLVETFGLNRFELDVLLICLAPTLDLRYERVYGYLQDDVTRKRPTINLTLDLLGEVGATRLRRLNYFAAEAPLRRYQLLEFGGETSSTAPLLSQTLYVDETIVSWLLGDYQPHTDLASNVQLLQPVASQNQTDELLVEETIYWLDQIKRVSPPPVIVFYGADRVSQTAAARHTAQQLGRPLLLVDLAAILKLEHSPLRMLQLALRDARLTGAIPYLSGWEALLSGEGSLSPGLLAELCDHPGLVIVAGQNRWQAEGIERERTLFWLEFPVPGYTQRLILWRRFLEKAGPAAEALDIMSVAGQFALTTGQIRDTLASARDMAAQRGEALQTQDLLLAARAHSNPRLATLARKIVPRYEWADIILPADPMAILQEIVATVRGRPQVLEQWGVGRKLASSAAVTVLFAGDPGTGKTMAAEVIAGELGLDLYKIDLSTMISKYIGETEKNLERIFSEAESSNAILFFDEADAIFGKRSEVKDAHDRYANIEVSYLLQRMEAYDGVTILATNLRANLDEAFTRRLQFAVDFPFPEKEYRLRIWQTLFPPEVPCDPNLNFELLARRFKLAGGNIRNIIISAAYQAAADGGQVTLQHLFHGTRRELQKMGRLIGEEDLRV